MDFPPSEIPDLQARLKRGEAIWTTRIDREMGRYWPGQTICSSLGLLKVTSVKRIGSVAEHPWNHCLLPEQREMLAKAGSMDVIGLRGLHG